MKEYDSRLLVNLLLPAVISFGIYLVTSSGVLSILPLLLMSEKLEGAWKKSISVGLVVLSVIILHTIQLGDIFQGTGTTTGVLIVGLFMPLSLLVSSGIWIMTAHRRYFERLVYSISIVVVCGFFYSIMVTWRQ